MGAPRPQGWFRDPFGAHEARYFSDGSPTRLVRDGETESYDEPPAGAPAVGSQQLTAADGSQQLTEVAPAEPDAAPSRPRRTLGRARGVMAITGVAAAVALVVVVVSAISERPVPGLRIALGPAVAVLVVGQIWVVIVLITRRRGGWRRLRPLGLGEWTELYFSPLPRGIVLGIFAVFAIGWLSAATAVLALTNGAPSAGTAACQYPAYYHGSMVCLSKSAWQRAVAALGVVGVAGLSHVTVNSLPPATGKPACPYRLDSHGSTTCASKAGWQHAVAAEERGAGGAMLGFFVADFGVAWSEVLRSRRARTTP
jgi:hypothetical protein